MEGLDAVALQGLSYRELQVLAKKHGLRANQKKQVLLSSLLPFAVAPTGVGVADVDVAAASNGAVEDPAPSKRARKTLLEEALEDDGGNVTAATTAVWGEPVALELPSPSKRARKTLIEEALEDGDDDVAAAPVGAWGETTPVRIKPVDESVIVDENGAGLPAGRSPRGIPLRPSGTIDFGVYREDVQTRAVVRRKRRK
jgi:hypothetical protein